MKMKEHVAPARLWERLVSALLFALQSIPIISLPLGFVTYLACKRHNRFTAYHGVQIAAWSGIYLVVFNIVILLFIVGLRLSGTSQGEFAATVNALLSSQHTMTALSPAWSTFVAVLMGLYLLNLVLAVLGFVSALLGAPFHYPLLGRRFEKRLSSPQA